MGTPLDDARYVSLETFKKDGTGVKTPVWAAPLEGKLVVETPGKTFKVKRIRNNPRVRVAACNGSGRTILGPFYDGSARILDDAAHVARAEAALAAKYGLLRRVFGLLAGIVRRKADNVYIELTLAEGGAAH